MNSIRLFWNPWNSQNRLSSLRLSLRQRLPRVSLANLLQSLQRKTRHSVHTLIKETGQTIIAGMGELHLEIIVDRLLREFKVEANVGAPQVAYKESITKAVDVDSKYAKQSGGRGQYGHCKVKFEPMDVNGEETYKFDSTVVGGAIPKEYIPAVGEGIEEAMKSGILGGFPGCRRPCDSIRRFLP